MWTDIYLINSPEQDSNYNHTPFFTSLTSQLNWYASKRVYTIDNANYHRKNNNLKVNYHIDDLALVNYVMVNNNDSKWYFYFVMDKVYINERTTELTLRLDVMQTYLFDFQLGNCLLERIHTKRYDSNGNVILEPMYSEEDFSSGEYSPFAVTDVYSYKDKGSYIITSSDLLGSGSQGGGGSIPSATGPATSNITEGFFVFMKAKEGFSATPYALGDGVLTIGYGVTDQKEEYNELAPSCTEEQASKLMYRLLLNDYYMPVYNLVIGTRNNPRQCEVEAFADLCYNGGLGAVTSSPMFQKYLDNETLSNCIVGWESWYITDASGTVYPGLITRRQQEKEMFLNAVYPKEAIAILGTGETLTDNDGKGYIPPEISGSGETTEIRQKIVSSAMKLIGLPYVYGGNYPPLGTSEGTDCSGLCQWAYNDAGATNLTSMSGRWTTYTMYDNSTTVSFSNALPGDVVFSAFSSPGVPEHVYIIKSIDVDNNTMNIVEAQQPGTNILQRTVTYNDSLEIRRLIQ